MMRGGRMAASLRSRLRTVMRGLSTALLTFAGAAFAGTLTFAGVAFAAAPEAATDLIKAADDIKTSDYEKFGQLLDKLDADSSGLTSYQQTYISYLKGWRTVYEREYEKAIPLLKAIVDQTSDITLRFRADVTLTNALALAGYYEEAYRRLSEALDLQARVPDTGQRMPGFAVAALLNNQAGQYDLAASYADRWLAEHNDDPGICKAMSLKIEALYLGKKLRTDDGLAAQGLAACKRSSEPMFANRIRNFVASLDVDSGRTADAIALLQGSYEEARRTQYPLLMSETDSVLAKAFWKSGDAEQASNFAQRAISEGALASVIKPVVDAYRVLYEVARQKGDIPAALSYHEKYAAADKGFLSETSARSLAYQMVNQQVLDKKRQIEALNDENRVLQLQHQVTQKSEEAERLYIVLLVGVLACLVLWAWKIKQSQLRFQKLARRDGLTGILNRQHFMDEAKMAVAYCARSSREACLILIDLDHFKDVNDSHGHVTGDGVLKRTVAICQLYMRSMDTYGRLGGEEFGVLLPDCALDVAAQRAEELRHAISSFVVGEKDRDSDVNVTASFGVTSTRYSGYDLRQMLIHADSALYRAKREGRNRVESHAAKSADAAPGANHGPAVIVLDGKV